MNLSLSLALSRRTQIADLFLCSFKDYLSFFIESSEMASEFDRWEKDPFFSAAEEVQESADRMESTYRTWILARNESSGSWNPDELRRNLLTTLGTTKWQLEQFERAVRSSYTNNSSADDTKDRHSEFIVAMESQISKVERSLNESAISPGKPPVPWVCLDEGERNELVWFLSKPSASGDDICAIVHTRNLKKTNLLEADKKSVLDSLRNSSYTVERGGVGIREEMLHRHRRTASASADIGAWKIAIADDVFSHRSSNTPPVPPPRKTPSFSGFLNTTESASKLKLPKNGYRKLRTTDCHQEADPTSKPQHLSRGINECYEKSQSCLDARDECYDKQHYGWYGTIQRQLKRSQYYMQYSRSIRVFFCSVVFCVIVLLVFLGI